MVGGSAVDQRNLISGNEGDGVFAGTDGTDTIQGNLIGTDKTGTKDLHNGTDNNGEGVNLGGHNSVVKDNIIAFNTSDGGAANDRDTGPNNLQDFPTITSATTSSSTGETEIDAFLDTVVSTEYVVRFYSNPRDTGEGKTFIGDILVVTNTNGTASINDFPAVRTVPVGQSITATATKVAPHNTSEFSGEPRSVRPAP